MSRTQNQRGKNGPITTELKQAIFPKVFQIQSPQNTPTHFNLPLIQNQFDQLKQYHKNARTAEDLAHQEEIIRSLKNTYAQQVGLIVELCTGLWRIQQNVNAIPEEELFDKPRRIRRHANAMLDNLTQAGYTIQDHTNSPYDAGLNLNVIAFEPTPNLTRETIIETVKPSIYFKKTLIRSGEVIVGTPENTQSGS